MTNLLAGAASADITPASPKGVLLGGFGFGRRSLGVLEPLSSRVLYLAGGGCEVALVAVDCAGLTRVHVDRIRERAASFATKTDVVVCATHTHSAPDTLGYYGPSFLGVFPRKSGIDPAYVDLLVERTGDAIERARGSARPAHLRAATFEVPPEWTRNDRKGGGRYDFATALAFDDASTGERLATLLDFASHPETLWERNRWISPDFPGPFRRHAESAAGGVALYFSGPLGGMLTPNVPRDATEEGRRAYIEDLGRTLAELTTAALAAAEVEREPTLEHRARPIRLRNGNWRFDLVARLGFVPSYGTKDSIETEVHHLRIGPVEVLSFPGEAVPELGHRVRGLMTAPHRLLLGLCIDELGYILEPRMWDDREYRYECSMSLGRGTADDLVRTFRELASAGSA